MELSVNQYDALQQAHREGKAEGIRLGWEQAKAVAKMVLCDICCYNSIDNPVSDECTYCNQHEAIASMTYKEAQDETSASYS